MHSYTPEQLLGMSRDLLNGGTEVNLRTRLDILMGHFMLLRSRNRLELLKHAVSSVLSQDFADLARHTLGVPSDHIKVALDAEATKATIQSLVTWARDSAPLDGRIYFYFSGHGAPDPASVPGAGPARGGPAAAVCAALAANPGAATAVIAAAAGIGRPAARDALL